MYIPMYYFLIKEMRFIGIKNDKLALKVFMNYIGRKNENIQDSKAVKNARSGAKMLFIFKIDDFRLFNFLSSAVKKRRKKLTL